MKIYWGLTLLTLLALILPATIAANCKASHFDFTGKYTLGKQDELNKTFTKIGEKIQSLDNVTYNFNATTSYTISNTKPVFYYRDTRQKAEIIGNDTIVISGGFLQVDLTFNWTKKDQGTTNGTGVARGLSDEIIFAKSVVIKDDFYSYELLDYHNVTWSNGNALSLERISPPDASDEDKAALTRLLNNILGVQTVRLELQAEIDKSYSYYLSNSLHDEHQPINENFDYIWAPGKPKPNITIPFSRRPVTVDIEPAGIQLTFDAQIKDYSGWKCGERNLPLLPLNPRVYGNTQEFISFDFYENVLRYAVQKQILTTDLNRESWESRMFQFFVGDIYEVLPRTQQKFIASQPLTGICRAALVGLKVWKATHETFNVSLHFDCELNVVRQKILQFSVGLQVEVQGISQATTNSFKIKNIEDTVTFYPYGEYNLANKDLAVEMIRSSLNRLREGNIFGSGWPQSPPRDYPHFIVEENYTTVYDSTHVDPDQIVSRIA